MVFSMNFDFLYSFNNLEIEYSIVLGISSEWNFQIFIEVLVLEAVTFQY